MRVRAGFGLLRFGSGARPATSRCVFPKDYITSLLKASKLRTEARRSASIMHDNFIWKRRPREPFDTAIATGLHDDRSA